MNHASVQDIKRLVAADFGVPVTTINGRRRNLTATLPRQVAMYLAREITNHTLPFLARRFDRDPTTVNFGINAVRTRMQSDPAFAARINDLARRAAVGIVPPINAVEDAEAVADALSVALHRFAARQPSLFLVLAEPLVRAAFDDEINLPVASPSAFLARRIA